MTIIIIIIVILIIIRVCVIVIIAQIVITMAMMACFSDGCGRAGTYCLIDMVLNRMAKGGYTHHTITAYLVTRVVSCYCG